MGIWLQKSVSNKHLHSLGGDGGGGDVVMWGYIEDKLSIHVCYLQCLQKKKNKCYQINWLMKYRVKQIINI
jgi:hypothetical protein